MIWKQLLLGIISFSSGVAVAGGVFALITTIGVVARIAGKCHTGKYARIYESSITWGGTAGNIFWLYQPSLPIGKIGLGIFGLFGGMFIGILAMSLAESLDITAIFTRRIRLSHGIPFIVFGIALGRGLGALLCYSQGWHD